MAEGDDGSGLEVDDALPEQDPFAQFVERAETSFNRATVGDDAWLRKIGAAPYRPPSDENPFANPWLIDHPTILSKRVESRYEVVEGEDAHALLKRYSPSAKLTFKTRVDEFGNLIGEGFGADGEKQYVRIIEEGE